MKKNSSSLKAKMIAIALAAVVMAGCSIIFEKNISKKTIQLDAPYDGAKLAIYNENFHWELLDGALSYQIQIVTPSFNTPVTYLLDSMVGGNTFAITLAPGIYQWRVRGVNGSSETPFTTFSFRVDTASLASQYIQLTAPTNGALLTSAAAVFTWQALFGAASYRVQIDSSKTDSIGFTSGPPNLVDTLIPSTSLSVTLPHFGKYYWRVRGEKDTAHSQYSPTAVFSYGPPVPGKVTLSSPSRGQTISISSSTPLSWLSVSGATAYTLDIFGKGQDSTKLLSTFRETGTSVTISSLNLAAGAAYPDTVYWAVSALNASGTGPSSNKSYFVLTSP